MFRVLVINVVILLALLLTIEIGMRVFRIYPTNNRQVTELDNGQFITIYKPHSWSVNQVETINIVNYNNLGFHDLDKDLTAPTMKFAFFGDSYVEGAQLSTDKLFTTLLARKFEGKGLDVLNFGFSGIGPANEYKLYQYLTQYGPRARFDYVYAAFYPGNDFSDSDPDNQSLPSRSFIVDTLGNIRQTAKAYSDFQRAIKFLTSHSAAINYLYTKLYILKQLKGGTQSVNQSVKTASKSPVEDSNQIIVASLAKMYSNWSKQVGADRFTLIIIDRDMRAKKNSKIHLLEDKLDEYGVRHIPLNMSNDSMTHYNLKGHYNEKGHLEWYRFMVKEIESRLSLSAGQGSN